MSRFRKKPVEVEALCWTGSNVQELATWAATAEVAGKKARGESLGPGQQHELPLCVVPKGDGTFDLEIRTSEGVMTVRQGDWVICGTRGEFYSCEPGLFANVWGAVDDDVPIPRYS